MAGNTNYASFFQRFVAALIDAIIIGIIVYLIGSIFRFSMMNGTYFNPLNLIGLVYAVYMLTGYGATLGKMAMNIKVVSLKTNSNLTVVEAIIREVGKFVSSIPLCLGFFWMLFDDKKQTWHDKFANCVVIKAK